jgi:hypothetical protein
VVDSRYHSGRPCPRNSDRTIAAPHLIEKLSTEGDALLERRRSLDPHVLGETDRTYKAQRTAVV